MKPDPVYKELALITDLGIQLILPIVGALIGGRFLIDKFELSRKWLLLVIIAGLGTGLYLAFKRIKQVL